MIENLYYLSSNKTKTSSYSFFMLIENGKIKVEEKEPRKIVDETKRLVFEQDFPPSDIKSIYPDYTGNIKYGVITIIKNDGKYLNGYLWKIDKNKYYTEIGNLITEKIIYLCDRVYVKAKPVDSSQESSLDNKKQLKMNLKCII